MTDNTPSRHGTGSKPPVIENWMIVDSTVAEAFGSRSEFTPAQEYQIERRIPEHNKENPTDPSFYEAQA